MSDRVRDFPEAQVFIPSALPFDLIEVAVVAVPPYEGLHLIQELLLEQNFPLLAANGGQVINLLQLKFRLKVFDFRLGTPQLKEAWG